LKQPKAFYDDLLVYADRTVKLAPDILPGHTVRVRALVGAGRYEEAVRAFEMVAKLPPPTEAMNWVTGKRGIKNKNK